MDILLVVLDKSSSISDVLCDPDGAAHNLYEALPNGIVLIRPDGYIGFRGAGNQIAALREYLARFFVAPINSPGLN